ncbi:MAG: stage V sporulation protein AE [Eubacteriales bacterium]|nr:stage V sporulation protein AE [Eubacteriales bacterium]
MLFMCIKAFVVGGLICVVGQLLLDFTKLTPAKILVSFVCLGVLLGGLGIYDRLVDFAGAGATIPLTGFGNALANGVKNAIREQGFMGVVTGALTACAGGVTVALISGLVVALVTDSKDK